MKRAAALDWKGFAKVKGYPIESEVFEVRGNDKNLDNVKQTEDVTVMVEDENELAGSSMINLKLLRKLMIFPKLLRRKLTIISKQR